MRASTRDARMNGATVLVVVSFLSFVMLGLPDGMLGIAWPSMSRSLSLPLGSLGALLLGGTVGYVSTTTALGFLITGLGYGRLLILSALSMTAGGVLIAVSPVWFALIAGAALMGAGGGMLDGGLNAYGAAHFRPRDLNWLHAAYGIGATLGPVVMTPLVVGGGSWRTGYVLFAVSAAVVAGTFFAIRRRWVPTSGDPRQGEDTPTSQWPRPPRLRVVVPLSVTLFFLYTGMEVVAGQWAFSLFTLRRGIPEAAAGTWVALYWGALTVGRIAFGGIAERVAPVTILRAVVASSVLSAGLILVPSPPIVGALGLVLFGASLAPMFPLLIAETPRRVGSRLAQHVIGVQIAAANLGAVSLVGAIGVGVESIGLEVVPMVLLAVTLAFALVHEVVVRLTAAPVYSDARS